MGISRQKGWSVEARLLNQISKQLSTLIGLQNRATFPTTTTSTTAAPTTTTTTTAAPTTTTTTTAAPTTTTTTT